MEGFNLVKRFTIYSFIAFVITGLLLGFVISNHVKQREINTIKEITLLSFDSLLKPYLTPQEFTSTEALNQASIKNLSFGFNQMRYTTSVLTLQIFNKHGLILYASNPKLIGTQAQTNTLSFEAYPLLTIARPAANFDSQEDLPEKVINIIAPISLDNQTVGFYEASINYEVVKTHVMELNKMLAIVMSLGLLLLYFFLLRVIHKASERLISQHESLAIRERDLQESYAKLNSAYKNTVTTLSRTVDARDSYTAGHSERVSQISLAIGSALGLPPKRMETLELAALFHDIGKLGIPDSILNKTGKLTDEEFARIKEHPTIGENILRNVDFLQDTLPIIRHHHERFSGNGYPDGIRTDNIPLESRIIAVADTYDAMTSDRPYRKGLPHEEAVKELIKFKEIQFDPVVVNAFLSTTTKFDQAGCI